MSAKPALPTSATVDPIDISYTEAATHIYIKVEDPKGLSPRWEGPYLITSRPSRSQVEVRLGSFADGSPRLQTYNWNTCKVAHLRPDMKDASRPKLGRPHLQTPPNPKPTENLNMADESSVASNQNKQAVETPAKIQTSLEISGDTSSRPVRSTRNPNPLYVDALNGHFTSIGA